MNLGQVFTKKIVADYMVGLLDVSKESHIVEPCCGNGVFIEALNKYSYENVTGIEIDKKAFDMIDINRYPSYKFICQNFFSYEPDKVIDAFILNPPYVRHEEIDNMNTIGVTKETLSRKCPGFSIYSKANLYLYFIARCVCLLRDGGQLVAIFPSVWVDTPGGRDFYRQLESFGCINTIINLSGLPFVGTPLVDVFIIKFTKGQCGNTVHYHLYVGENEFKKVTPINVVAFEKKDCVALSSIATIRRGLTTGYNSAFINPILDDPSLTVDILSTPKNVVGYTTVGAKLDKLLIIKNDTVIEGHVKRYIDNWENTILSTGKPKNIVNNIQVGGKWYVLPRQKIADIFFPYIIRDKIRFIYNESKVLARDNFYTITSDVDSFLLLALLNNYFTYSQLERCGKLYGNGILKLQKYDLEGLMIPNPKSLNKKVKQTLIDFARGLFSNAQNSNVKKITKLVQPYYQVDNIYELYESQKKARLSYAIQGS